MTTQPTEATMTDAELDALVALGEGITPGEFFVCHPNTECDATTVCNPHSETDARAIAAVPDLIAALTTLRKQRDELREALEPFARIGDKLLSVNGWGDEDKITVDLSHSFDVLERLEVQAFRTARQALSNMEGE